MSIQIIYFVHGTTIDNYHFVRHNKGENFYKNGGKINGKRFC